MGWGAGQSFTVREGHIDRRGQGKLRMMRPLFFAIPEDGAVLHVHPLLVQIREAVVANNVVITAIGGRKHSRSHLAFDLGIRKDVQ